MIQLPITEKELEYIIKVVKDKNPQLYGKLWSYKINELRGERNGFS